MSSKAKKMGENIVQIQNKEKMLSMFFRVDLKFDDSFVSLPKTNYYLVSGIPESMYNEDKQQVIQTARQQYASVLMRGGFIELYNQGKTSKDEMPVFFNISLAKSIAIFDFYEVDENFQKIEG